MKTYNCKTCGTERLFSHQTKNMFCSTKCHGEYRTKQKDDFTLDFFFDLVEVLIIFLKLFRGEQCGDQVKPFPIVHVVLVRV